MNPADTVLCDMAPNFSGDLDSDHLTIADMNHTTLQLCDKNLKIGGTLVLKTL
jgi:23S rRNA U2552 (ribose-2'-O)-methylase RlmE/FtsJ